jgi:hypothetical protein
MNLLSPHHFFFIFSSLPPPPLLPSIFSFIIPFFLLRQTERVDLAVMLFLRVWNVIGSNF